MGIWDSEERVPIFVQVTIETTGTLLLGSDISAAVCALEELPIDGIGMNCATGPREMAENVRYLGRACSKLDLNPARTPVCRSSRMASLQFPLQPEAFGVGRSSSSSNRMASTSLVGVAGRRQSIFAPSWKLSAIAPQRHVIRSGPRRYRACTPPSTSDRRAAC